jgi:hypothetical protein
MSWTVFAPAPKGDPRWRVVFVKRAKLKTLELKAKTEGLAVRELIRRHVDLKLIQSLTQISVGFITFLFTLVKK